jgi:hypothetical protein
VLGLNLVLNAPWLVAGAVHPGGARSDPAGVAAFAARGEGPGGPLATLLGLGGIWNADVVPASRHGLLVPVTALVLLAGAGYGVVALGRHWGAAPARALAGLAVGGLVLALAGAVPGTGGGLRWAVGHLGGAGLLRDGQKWTAWFALLAALGGALAVEALASRLPGRAAVLTGAMLLPLALLPDLAWGGLGRLTPVRYPADWSAVRDTLAADPRPGDVLVLPFQAYRRFGWNADRPQLDPAPRFLPRATVVDDTLRVGGVDVSGEDRRAAWVRDELRGRSGALGAAGIGWVLVEHGTPGTFDPSLVDGLDPVYIGTWLTLLRVPGAVTVPATGGGQRAPVLVADVAALVLVAVAVLRRWLPIGRLRFLNGSGSTQEGGSRADVAGRRGGHHSGRAVGRDRGVRDRGDQRAGHEG